MKRVYLLSAIMVWAIVILTGCQYPGTQKGEALTEERTEELHSFAGQFTEYLNNNDGDNAMEMMDETLKEAMDGKLEDTWKQLTDSYGAFQETGNYVGSRSDEYDIFEMTLIFEKGTMIQRTVFDDNNLVSGLFFLNGKL